jgi:hypothetical protein
MKKVHIFKLFDGAALKPFGISLDGLKKFL